MHISTEGLALIRRFEGFSATPYADAAEKMTIGYGHLIRPGERFDRICAKQAEALLRADTEVAGKAVLACIAVSLSQPRFNALCSFTFNVGAGALSRSTLRRLINQGRHAEVPAELARWVWAGGKKLPGLIARRQAEGELYGH